MWRGYCLVWWNKVQDNVNLVFVCKVLDVDRQPNEIGGGGQVRHICDGTFKLLTSYTSIV